jgi:hypothetical protein
VTAPLVEDGIIDTGYHHHYQSGCNIFKAIDETLNENRDENQDSKPDKLTVRRNSVAFKEVHDDNHWQVECP